MRGLAALCLEAPAPVVADVRNKVLAVYIEKDAEIAKMQATIDHLAADLADRQVALIEWANTGLAQDIEIQRLREAIAAWKPYWHGANCNIFDYGSYAAVRCNCGADEKNLDRYKARKLAGLEVDHE